MADPTRKYDQLKDEMSVRERVRKLEVLDHSRTLIPALWKPVEDRTQLMFDLFMLLACVDHFRPSSSGILAPVRTRPEAQYAYLKLLDRGYGIGESVKASMTESLWRLELLPPPTAMDPMNFSEGADPDAPTYLITSRETNWQGRNLEWVGFPAQGSWGWVAKGVHPGWSWVVPDLGSLRNWSDTADVIPEGAMMGDFSPEPDGILGRNNQYGTLALHDCEGPDEPLYNGRSYPGIPVTYDSGSVPCPAFPTAPSTSGSIWRARMFLPVDNMYLDRVPFPFTGGGTTFADFAPDLHMDFVAAGIEYGISTGVPCFPFFQSLLDQGEAVMTEKKRKNWQALDMFYPWLGLVEAQYREGLVTFRGKARLIFPDWWVFNQSPSIVRLPNILNWSPSSPGISAGAAIIAHMNLTSDAGSYSGPLTLQHGSIGTEDRYEEQYDGATDFLSLESGWIRNLIGDDGAKGTCDVIFDGATIYATKAI